MATSVNLQTGETPLDVATKLVQSARATFRPTIGEHCVQVKRRTVELLGDPEPREVDRQRSETEARRRAAVVIRRYAVHNRIDRLVTLTFAGTGMDFEQRGVVVQRVQTFIRKLRSLASDVVYVYVLEVHPGGHGYHVHIGLNRWIAKETIRACWPHGFIDIRRIKTKAHRGRESQRLAARYLAKYSAKAHDDGRDLGSHRYERRQGCNPPEFVVEGSLGACLEFIADRVTSNVWQWWSSAEPGWPGPLTVIFRDD